VFDFQPLEEFVGPVDEDDVLTDPEGAMVNKLTFYSPHSFCNNQDLMSRQYKALEIGGKTFNWQLVKLTSEHFSRRLLNDAFPNESSILNNLLISCNRVTTTTGYAFTIKREPYHQILSALYQIRKTHGDLVLAEGYPVPKLPLWGSKGDITEYHLDHEYEILTISFRAEVEAFLIAFDKHYNFLTGTLRSEDLIVNVPSRDPPPHLPITPSMRSICKELSRDPRRPSPVHHNETRLKTGSPRDRHQSNLYNFGGNKLSIHLCRGHPEGSPHWMLHTNKLKEVLGDPQTPTDNHPVDSSHMNRPPTHNSRARSDDLERDSSSTQIFQNWNQASIPLDHDASDFEDEGNDHGHLP